jgi:hypothetical protein
MAPKWEQQERENEHEDVWRSGVVAPPFLSSTLDGMNDQHHGPIALPPGMEPPVPVGH